MSNLLSSLRAAANSMKAFEQAMNVVSNNVTNASTPGYARQGIDLVALRFQPEHEMAGGVEAGTLISSRSLFAEQAVWRQAEQHGSASQLAAGLAEIEPIFDIAEGSGVGGALESFYGSFSQLSIAPNDIPSRQIVLSRAEELANAFNFTANSLARAGDSFQREFRSVIDQINSIASEVRDLNVEFRNDYRNRNDAGLNARMYAALEELSQLVDFNALPQDDGTMTLLFGGQTPLVIGDKVFAVTADVSGPAKQILDFKGDVITGQVNDGKLKGLLELTNNLLPHYSGELDRLAASLADQVNAVLAGGLDLSGNPPATGLFQYDAGNGAAKTLAVTGIAPEEIAAAAPGAPGGNTNALNVAGLATAPRIDGFTFSEFYGQLSAQVGRKIASTGQEERSQSLLLSQARYLRDMESGVNLNEEAAVLVQYQRAYQASAQMIKTINEMTETLLQVVMR